MKIKIKPKPRPKLPLETFRLQNFKAVRDSGPVTFTPLTVFIGNNGSGKSSLVEGLETFQNIVLHGLDEAFLPWRGFEHIWNKAVSHQLKGDQIGKLMRQNPMSFQIAGGWKDTWYRGTVEIATDLKENQLLFTKEDIVPFFGSKPGSEPTPELRNMTWRDLVGGWQFLNLEPRLMLDPKPERRTGREIRLAKDGSNIAQYLQSIADKDPAVLEGIAETLKNVLPYATDLRPAVTTELQRTVYLRLSEDGLAKEHILPSWLLSQGTLRIVALFAVLRHPKPPSVLFIEELENGLDPRTIHLVVEEVRSFLQSGGQVVATTHSPYLLDLLDLSHLIVVERTKSGAPTFRRPSRRKLKDWAEKFAPGRLYTMGNLTEN
jgi:AAA domain, putative AbiEii toxin, Type IV TA system/AAA ATPase domain